MALEWDYFMGNIIDSSHSVTDKMTIEIPEWIPVECIPAFSLFCKIFPEREKQVGSRLFYVF